MAISKHPNKKKHLFEIVIAIISVIFLLSCTEEEVPVIQVQPVNNWNYLIDTVDLGNVSVSLIKITTQLAGYPQFNKYMKHSITIYKLVYYTTFKGEKIRASGIITFPKKSTDSIPVIVVGNGLIFADEDAPSEFDLPENYTGFEFIASLGYITLIPDMIGFGESKDLLFPIHNKEISAQTMIDFIFASKEFIKAKNLAASEKTFLTGYSQGGHIAMSTLKKVEENPILGIKFEAAAIGAGGFNLVTLLDNIVAENTYSAPSHLAMLFSSYNEIYEWGHPLSYFFQQQYAAKIPDLISGNYDRLEINQQLAYSFDSLLNPEFVNKMKAHSDLQLIAALEENSVYNWAPKTPLRIIHSINDDRLPLSDSEETYNAMVTNGSENVEFIKIETDGHINSGLEFIEIVLTWFESLRN